ncbi:wound-responsive protein GWIN3-like [Populus alba x Populus x berolinensis]|uniref:Wound-responsive protein GWIN3-like n=1 Tax=Populus alba x Populus x berolinensis TaxID=444605 RepID=A0AAD6PPU5_9ROSI|nr:wound-responsive protein GWIN3-like [Populus alba x Populus x berolinensis]
MKITKFAVLSFLLFAFTATSIFPHAVHAQDPEAVIDVNGNEVTADARYFIGAASDDNTTTLAGLPVTFSSPVGESGDGTVIREDSYLNVNFVAATCRMAGVSTMWKTELRPTMRGFVVTTGGVDGLNRFKITKYEGGNNLYQLSYCPISDPMCECSCACVPLGNVVDRLAPSTVPFPVVFEPVADQSS